MARFVRRCRDCGAEFAFGDAELKGMEGDVDTLPRRCVSCREAKKQEKQGRQEEPRRVLL